MMTYVNGLKRAAGKRKLVKADGIATRKKCRFMMVGRREGVIRQIRWYRRVFNLCPNIQVLLVIKMRIFLFSKLTS